MREQESAHHLWASRVIDHLPVLAVCGYSGSGKTTLIEQILRSLSHSSLRVAVVKHDVHGLQVDRRGKDSFRFFEAGSDVILQSTEEHFMRSHQVAKQPLKQTLLQLGGEYDLILVEGHKDTPFRHKVWLLSDGECHPPKVAGAVKMALPRGQDRLSFVLPLVEDILHRSILEKRVYAGVLIGGASSRMGRPKHLMESNGRSWLEIILSEIEPLTDKTVILGEGMLPSCLSGMPVLPDAPGIHGPIAGMVAAMRWQPYASWTFVACDMPLVCKSAISWLLDQRRPGQWAVMPRLGPCGRAEPLLAWYDCRIRPYIEIVDSPRDLAKLSIVGCPLLPPEIQASWTNINSQTDHLPLGV